MNSHFLVLKPEVHTKKSENMASQQPLTLLHTQVPPVVLVPAKYPTARFIGHRAQNRLALAKYPNTP